MRGKGVAQGVRRDLFGDAGLARVALDDVAEDLARTCDRRGGPGNG